MATAATTPHACSRGGLHPGGSSMRASSFDDAAIRAAGARLASRRGVRTYDDEARTLVYVKPIAAPKGPAKRREGTKLHWAVLAMAAFIAVGLWLDPASRVRVFAQARTTAANVMAKLPHR